MATRPSLDLAWNEKMLQMDMRLMRMIQMGKQVFGSGLSMVAKFVLFALIGCLASGCRQKGTEIDLASDPYNVIDQFWSSSMQPGWMHRSIGFSERFGLYSYWERTDVGPFNPLHTARGEYRDKDGKCEIIHPFGEIFVLRHVVESGVSCLVPDSMSFEEAREKGWLLIRRSGYTPTSPFAIDGETVLDKK